MVKVHEALKEAGIEAESLRGTYFVLLLIF
jgi:hypothetical protein